MKATRRLYLPATFLVALVAGIYDSPEGPLPEHAQSPERTTGWQASVDRMPQSTGQGVANPRNSYPALAAHFALKADFGKLRALFRDWAKADPQAAIKHLTELGLPETNGPESPYESVRAALLEGWMLTDPLAAVRWLAETGGPCNLVPEELFALAAKRDARIALQYLSLLSSRITQPLADISLPLFSELLESNPAVAIEQARAICNSSPDLFVGFLRAYSERHGKPALQNWIRISSLKVSDIKSLNCLSREIGVAAGQKSALVFRLEQSSEVISSEQFAGEISTVASSGFSNHSHLSQYTRGLLQNVMQWALDEPVEARKWAYSQTDEELRHAFLSQVALAPISDGDATTALANLLELPEAAQHAAIASMAQITANYSESALLSFRRALDGSPLKPLYLSALSSAGVDDQGSRQTLE